MPSARQLRRALEENDRAVIRAFLESVARIQGNVVLSEVVEAIESRNVDQVFGAIGITPGSYREFNEALRTAYVSAGVLELSDLPRVTLQSGQTISFDFDSGSPRAESFLRSESARRVVLINETQRDAIRVALDAGLQRGDNPRRTALNIVGRVNGQTRRREGGVIGLDPTLANAATNARSELFSSDPAELVKALDRKLLAAGSKRQIRATLNRGETLPARTANRIATMYESAALKLRGDRIGRTEALNAFEAGRSESVKQVIDTGAADEVDKIWDAAGDNRVRDSHRNEDGQKVAFDQPFILSSGARLMHPGDTGLGAPAGEIINCRCITRYEFDFFGQL